VLDDHRKDGGEGCLNDLRRDADFGSGGLDETGAAEALLYLVGGCGGVLSGSPVADVLGHSVVLEGVENALNTFGVLGERFNKTTCNFGLIGAGSGASLTSERLNHIHNSHVVHLAPQYMTDLGQVRRFEKNIYRFVMGWILDFGWVKATRYREPDF
jgi:hypothetical protein